MKEENKILDKIAHRDGFTVPDGYFDDFCSRMTATLPQRPELENPVVARPRTPWQRIRPYAYMAAMFAGVWCLLKMVTMMSNTPDEINFDNDPILAEAASNIEFVDEFILDDISTYDIYESYREGDIDLNDSILLEETLMNDSTTHLE